MLAKSSLFLSSRKTQRAKWIVDIACEAAAVIDVLCRVIDDPEEENDRRQAEEARLKASKRTELIGDIIDLPARLADPHVPDQRVARFPDQLFRGAGVR